MDNINMFKISVEELTELLKKDQSEINFSMNLDFSEVKAEYKAINNNGEIEVFILRHDAFGKPLGYYLHGSFKNIEKLKYGMTHYF
jgi:hypothetical protein